jgi:hypothetical protein
VLRYLSKQHNRREQKKQEVKGSDEAGVAYSAEEALLLAHTGTPLVTKLGAAKKIFELAKTVIQEVCPHNGRAAHTLTCAHIGEE